MYNGKNPSICGNTTKVMVQPMKHENEKREMIPIENLMPLFLGSTSGSFVANRAFEHLISSVKVEFSKQKQKTRKSYIPQKPIYGGTNDIKYQTPSHHTRTRVQSYRYCIE